MGRETYQRVACSYSVLGDTDRDSQIYHVPGMRSRRESKLDSMKSKSKGTTNKAPTCAMPMHAPQTSSSWRGMGEVSRSCEVGCGGRV